MPAWVLQLVVFAVELAAKYGPGLIEVGERFFEAITSSEMTDAEKADLINRVKSSRARVAAYEPRPRPVQHEGSPSVVEPPKPTRPG